MAKLIIGTSGTGGVPTKIVTPQNCLQFKTTLRNSTEHVLNKSGKSIVDLSNVDTIGNATLAYAYYNADCTEADEYFDFSNISNVWYEGMKYAFYGTHFKSGQQFEFSQLRSVTAQYAMDHGFNSAYFGGGTVNFPVLENPGEYCFNYAFGSSDLTGASFPALRELKNNYIFHGAFAYANGITSMTFPLLETIGVASTDPNTGEVTSTYTGCCAYMFDNAHYLRTLSFPVLKRIAGNYCCHELCYYAARLETVDLGALEEIYGGYSNGRGALAEAFEGCSALTFVDLKSLKRILGNVGTSSYSRACPMGATFCDCRALVTQSFQSLENVSGRGMYYCFSGCTSLEDLWFYALSSSSFGAYTTQFDNMLSGCSGVTVHFPMTIQSTIGSWSSVTGGFGGTNTTVLFDLVTSLTGADTNTYTRSEKDSTSTATAWKYNDTLYYTSGVSNHAAGVHEPTVGATIYSDATCTTSVTTISAIA